MGSDAIPMRLGSDQTATASPLIPWDKNYSVTLKQLQNRQAAFPTLQSFSVGQTKLGEWVMIGGRTSGLHKFTDNGLVNFPPSKQNDMIWVYDPVQDKSWSRPLSESGLSADQQLSLSTNNAQQFQRGNVMFRVGGYVYDKVNKSFETRNRLSAIKLNSLVNWTKGKTKQLPQNSVLSVAGEPMQVEGKPTYLFAVTGGELLKGRNPNQALLIFGQDFAGAYTTGVTGLYTSQVRSFDINYKPRTKELSYILNSVSKSDPNQFGRRDLNVVTQLHRDDKGELVQKGTALAGVFYKGLGVWTVPVEIDLLTGQPTMPAANDPATFKQAVNQYTAANVGVFSRCENNQTNLVFGGISAVIQAPSGLSYYVNLDNESNQPFPYPFTSQIAAFTSTADGRWKQSLAGSFPIINDSEGDPLTFGASSVYVPIDKGQDPQRVRYLADGVLNLDRLRRNGQSGTPVLVGYVVGGIASQVSNNFDDLSTYGGTNYTHASGEIFQVLITPH